MVTFQQVVVTLQSDNSMDYWPDIRVAISDDVAQLIFRCPMDDDQITLLVERFHAVPVHYDVRHLPSELHRGKDDPGGGHSHQQQGRGNSVNPAQLIHGITLQKGRNHPTRLRLLSYCLGYWSV